ncbi:CBS domain-containing protein [Sessilibacter corallicola]|uniref:CBS domain-containing protein n=1 Tax=Sessilibacter corallicola TaxID=2904075 RepID=A0ABQ0A6T9_9GAMM|nr:CBS domain-containing protein [Sessilibacter corallicola]MCE2028546.1 CBS domain-containing protein [Sessilibacter corallicola]
MESLKVSDYMTTDFVKFHEEDLVIDSVKELIKHEVIGGPVVSNTGEVIGWISEQDCLGSAIQVIYYNQRVAQVRDIMRTEVLSVREDDDLLSLAQQMLQNKPKVYPVLSAEGKLTGVISRRLILRAVDKRLAQLGKEPRINQPHEAHLA